MGRCLMNFLSRLVLSRCTPHLCLLSSWDYRRETLVSSYGNFKMWETVTFIWLEVTQPPKMSKCDCQMPHLFFC
jgi:hypothetical protein